MTTTPLPERGQVWDVDLEPTRGAEIRKVRPCIVINVSSVGRLPLRVVVPITEWDARFASYSWMIRLDPAPTNGLTKTSVADTFQLCSVALERFGNHLGRLTDDEIERIAAAIALVVGAP